MSQRITLGTARFLEEEQVFYVNSSSFDDYDRLPSTLESYEDRQWVREMEAAA